MFTKTEKLGHWVKLKSSRVSIILENWFLLVLRALIFLQNDQMDQTSRKTDFSDNSSHNILHFSRHFYVFLAPQENLKFVL